MANKNKNNKKKCISHSSRAGLQVLSPFFSSLELSLCIGVHFFLGRFVLFCALLSLCHYWTFIPSLLDAMRTRELLTIYLWSDTGTAKDSSILDGKTSKDK